jgi:DNA-binding beta-propeller fold protein YncE
MTSGSLFLFLALAVSICPNAVAGDDSDCQLCLYGPDNMVFDAVGNIYLTDSDHKSRFRVVKISADGRLLDEWHPFEAKFTGKQGPEGIAIDLRGEILVTDAGARAVLKLSPTGKVLMRVDGAGADFEDLGHVAVDSAGNIYVAEAARNLIQKFSPAGEQIAVWKKAKGAGPDEWNNPETIAVRPDNTVVVEDWGNHRVVVLSPLGKALFAFGEAGSGPGQFRSSAGLAVDRQGDIYVADDKLHRVQKFDASGRLLSIYSNDGSVRLFTEGPGAIAVDEKGNLYAPDGLTILKLSPQGGVLARWR